jgi:protein SCO1/2
VLGLSVFSAPPPVTGTPTDQAVPDVALIDQHGSAIRLSDVRGKVVVIYPFLTACQEVCPMTTGAFVLMSHAIQDAGLGNQVELWEVTVDPDRDTPQRLSAYADLASADWRLLTGSSDNLRRFWDFFGVWYEKTKTDAPAPIDWYTDQPETYDVGHTPVLIFVDAAGHERIVLVGTADLGGQLSPTLRAMLNDAGRQNLAQPAQPWTVRQALDDVGSLLGHHIPPP